MTLFINESQVAFLEDMMRQRGVLDTTQMAGAFQLLRSNDLIWSRAHARLSDGRTRAAQRSDGLERRRHAPAIPDAFANICASCSSTTTWPRAAITSRASPISLSDIHTPMFVVGTVRDHVAPWRSAYKIHYQVDADVTYPLDQRRPQRGHRGSAEPAGAHVYQVSTKKADAPYVGPDEWLKTAPRDQKARGGRNGPNGSPPAPASRRCHRRWASRPPQAKIFRTRRATTFAIEPGFTERAELVELLASARVEMPKAVQ